MKLYVVRHGKTDWNTFGRIQGDTDIPLNRIGEKQAELIRNKIEDKVDICITSPLERAIRTANIICDLEVIIDERLKERDMGEYEGVTNLKYNKQEYWNYKLNKSDYGVEPIQDLFKRVNEFLDEIKNKYADKTVLVVSHGATIRALHYCINSYTEDEDFLKLDVPNCAVFKYEIKS